MVKIKLKYIVEDVDRHGNVRIYFRRKGEPKIRIYGLPHTEEFMQQYRKALNGTAKPNPKYVISKILPNSLHWLCWQYYLSADYIRLDPQTQHVKRLILDKLCEAGGENGGIKHGDKPFAKLEPRHVRKLRDEKMATPAAANNMLKALKSVYAYAVEMDLIVSNPCRDVKRFARKTDGFHSWSVEEINQFEGHHPIGSMARLAMALLLYTGQRRSDVVKMGRQMLREGCLHFTQTKTTRSGNATLIIPIIQELQQIIEATPSGNMTFLINGLGRPFTANGFGNKFREWCNQAGLPHCSAHGLRKAISAILAERGATEKQIMSITGHRSMGEVTSYTRAARQKVLAVSAMDLLSGTKHK